MAKKGVILSGMRPTGRLQLGNLLGALDNWVKLQDDYSCYFSVVDWHALTTEYETPGEILKNVDEMVIDWLSAGLDPERSVIFRQSEVKEHAELHLLLSMITPLSWLERCPSYKDQMVQLKEKNIATYGFLGYPLLQAADILIYKANNVPVGEDQAPHIEMTREIARRFNHLYREVFPEPGTLLNRVRLLPGTDGRKMSKSYGNTINMTAGPGEIQEKVRSMVTDPQRIRKDDPGHPEVCTVFAFHQVFNPQEVSGVEGACRGGETGCVQCKKDLAGRMMAFMEPMYQKRQELTQRPDYIRSILAAGQEKAREKARQTMEEVRAAMML